MLAAHRWEFFTLSFHHPMAIFFEGLLILGAMSVVWYVSRGRYTESLVLMMWAHAGLLAARNVPLFAVVAAPLVATAVAGVAHATARSGSGVLVAFGLGPLQ